MANRKTSKLSYSESLPDDQVVEIEIERIREFRKHPFRVVSDQQMLQLIKSIQHYGILHPLLVRPLMDGTYEIISGHRRKYAAEQLGYRKVPVIIRVMEDEEAILFLVDSNLHRENIPLSEKAFSYKMKYDILKYDSSKKESSQIDYLRYGKRTVEIIGKEYGDSPKQVQRFLKLTELIPEMLEKLDDGFLSFCPAVELAFLRPDEQRMVLDAMDYAQAIPSLSQAQRIKKLSQEETLTLDAVRDILSEIKKSDVERVSFKNEQLRRYFPRNYSAVQMKREILEILKKYMDQKTGSDRALSCQ